jgi:hypothetical protein
MRLKKILDTSSYLPKTLYHNSDNKSDSVKLRWAGVTSMVNFSRFSSSSKVSTPLGSTSFYVRRCELLKTRLIITQSPIWWQYGEWVLTSPTKEPNLNAPAALGQPRRGAWTAVPPEHKRSPRREKRGGRGEACESTPTTTTSGSSSSQQVHHARRSR